MTPDERPAIVAYDGSAEAQEAVRAAAGLLGHRKLIVVSVWEPGLALMMSSTGDPAGMGYAPPPDPATMAAMDEAQHDHATQAAAAGVELARSLGATAEPHPVPDEVNVPSTIAHLAEQIDAAAIVIGSRGLGRVKASLLGSTSHELLRATHRPVVVVRLPE